MFILEGVITIIVLECVPNFSSLRLGQKQIHANIAEVLGILFDLPAGAMISLGQENFS